MNIMEDFMIQDTIYIDQPVETVWNFVETEFAKVFQCNPKQLLGKKTQRETVLFSGKTVTLVQEVISQKQKEEFSYTSEHSKDIVTTVYRLESYETGTLLSLEEKGQGSKSKLRTANFTMFSLPILNRRVKKKIARQLEGIKSLIENEEDEEV